jgi:hypothetical protein
VSETVSRGRAASPQHGGARRAAPLAVAAGIALLAAACGGASSTGSTPAAGSTTYQKMVAYSQCMRAHGVPDFPDPGSNGVFAVHGNLGVSRSTMTSAQNACRHLAPKGGRISAAQRAQAVSQGLKFSRCMRSHGEPKFPDPNSQGELQGNSSSSMNPQSPQFQAAQRACQSLLSPPGGGAP